MIAGDSQILFTHDFHNRVGAPIITTGNELQGNEIAEFSEKLNIKELYLYVKAVKESTDQILGNLTYKDLKQKFGGDVKEKLIRSKCVRMRMPFGRLITGADPTERSTMSALLPPVLRTEYVRM